MKINVVLSLEMFRRGPQVCSTGGLEVSADGPGEPPNLETYGACQAETTTSRPSSGRDDASSRDGDLGPSEPRDLRRGPLGVIRLGLVLAMAMPPLAMAMPSYAYLVRGVGGC